MPSKPITVHGETYSSRVAASVATGLSPSALRKAERENRLDTTGTRANYEHQKNKVTWRGEEFESQAELSRYLGVSKQAVSDAIKRGTVDKIERREANDEKGSSI